MCSSDPPPPHETKRMRILSLKPGSVLDFMERRSLHTGDRERTAERNAKNAFPGKRANKRGCSGDWLIDKAKFSVVIAPPREKLAGLCVDANGSGQRRLIQSPQKRRRRERTDKLRTKHGARMNGTTVNRLDAFVVEEVHLLRRADRISDRAETKLATAVPSPRKDLARLCVRLTIRR